MKINSYSCMGFFQVVSPHNENIHKFIPEELYQYLKFDKNGNTCGHKGKIPIEYKNDYMKLRICRIQYYYNNIIEPLFIFSIILIPLLIVFGIIRKLLDLILIQYYKHQFRKTKGHYFNECYLLKDRTTISFDKSDL